MHFAFILAHFIPFLLQLRVKAARSAFYVASGWVLISMGGSFLWLCLASVVDLQQLLAAGSRIIQLTCGLQAVPWVSFTGAGSFLYHGFGCLFGLSLFL